MQEEGSRAIIEPYYKPGNVFERDQAYYSQAISGPKRSNLKNTRQVSQSRVNQRLVNTMNVHERRGQEVVYEAERREDIRSNTAEMSVRNRYQQPTDPRYREALEKNNQLKNQFERLIGGNTDFGLSQNVVKLSHYSGNQNDLGKIKEQQAQIRRLQAVIEQNKVKIEKYKKAGEQLTTRMNNIQSIDKQIYKTLQSSTNRDKELLDRASSALARGERREEIAKILQQIIG